MIDELLPFYNNELRYFRELARGFSTAHPKIASRLRLSKESIDDPNVGRLVESFALLTARIRHKLDDDFPELTDGLLGILAPHLLTPVPSTAIARITPNPALKGKVTIAVGSELDTESVQGHSCTYRTCSPVELWPITITRASLAGRPAPAPANLLAPGAAAILRLEIDSLDPQLTLADAAFDKLRFYLSTEPLNAHILYELLSNNVVSIAVASSTSDREPLFLPPQALRAVGLDPDETILPSRPGSFTGYALLAEYFVTPEKFMFFELSGFTSKIQASPSSHIEVFIYLDRTSTQLERTTSAGDFTLFATPIVNLFKQDAEPLRLTLARPENRIVADARRESVTEIYGLESVSVTNRRGETRNFRPLFGLSHYSEEASAQFYHATRRESLYAGGGDDVFITLVDRDGQPSFTADDVLSTSLTCFNRNLPSRLPSGGGRPLLSFREASASVAAVQCITAPTVTARPKRAAFGAWKLVAQLSLNHLSVSDNEKGASALQEMLALYDHLDSSASRAVRDRIASIKSKSATARVPATQPDRERRGTQGRIAFCSGTDITLEFDDTRLSGSGTFLLGAVLERFFANYCTINSFSRLTLKLRGEKDVWKQWPARSGKVELI